MKILRILICLACLLGISACQTPSVNQRKPLELPCLDCGYAPYKAYVFFNVDSATINLNLVRDRHARKLDELISYAKKINLEAIIVLGHTDALGTAAYNNALSLRRAVAVKAYLISKGIPAIRIYTEGKGKSDPYASNETASGRARNRRAEIELIGRKK